MRLIVCGGRDFGLQVPVSDPLHQKRKNEELFIWIKMNELYLALKKDLVVITGNAKGVDQNVERWAEHSGVQNEIYPANWKLHGRAAGPIRNQQMLDEGKPDGVIAFPGGNGTAHMCRIAEKAGLKVKRIPYVFEIPFERTFS